MGLSVACSQREREGMLREGPKAHSRTQGAGRLAGASLQGCHRDATSGDRPCLILPPPPASPLTPREWGLGAHVLWISEKVQLCPHWSHGKWQRGFSGFRVVVWLC